MSPSKQKVHGLCGALKAGTGVASLLAVHYLSEAWAERALVKVETDPRIAEAVNGIDVSVLSIILEAPKDCYGFLYVRFEGGGLADYRVGHDYTTVTKGLEEPTFVVSGNYDVFLSVQRGQLSERRAIMKRKLHLTGSVVKALRYMRALESITAVLREVECDA